VTHQNRVRASCPKASRGLHRSATVARKDTRLATAMYALLPNRSLPAIALLV
jgi:hypothetical protein